METHHSVPAGEGGPLTAGVGPSLAALRLLPPTHPPAPATLALLHTCALEHSLPTATYLLARPATQATSCLSSHCLPPCLSSPLSAGTPVNNKSQSATTVCHHQYSGTQTAIGHHTMSDQHNDLLKIRSKAIGHYTAGVLKRLKP